MRFRAAPSRFGLLLMLSLKVSDDPMTDAISIANDICKVAPLAVRETLETLRRGQELGGRTLQVYDERVASYYGL